MKTWTMAGAAVLCASLAVACGGDARDSETAEQADVRPEPTTVSGCLTEANGQYVLTVLEPEGGSTETYQLANADDDIRQYVGREVSVAGEAEAPRVAEVRESTPAVGTSGDNGAEQSGAQVSTEARTRLETRRLSVISVTPTGDPCPTGSSAR